MNFIKTLFTTTLITTTIIYGFIYAIDPYNKFGVNLFNVKTKAVDFARENKFNQIENTQKPYEAFIMGSSSAHRYRTKDITTATGYLAYNYSTQSATAEDFLAMTRHILSKKFPIKLLIISMDFEALSDSMPTDDMFFSSPLKVYLNEEKEHKTDLFNNTYFTLKALNDSLNVLFVNYFGHPQHAYLENGDHIVEPKSKVLKVSQFHYFTEFNQKRLDYFREIKKLGDLHHFKIIVFTSPLSLEHIQKILNDSHLKMKHEEFKKILVNIFGELYDFQNLDIAPYNSVDFFGDSNHPNHDFSKIILERIFHPKEKDLSKFGERLK